MSKAFKKVNKDHLEQIVSSGLPICMKIWAFVMLKEFKEGQEIALGSEWVAGEIGCKRRAVVTAIDKLIEEGLLGLI